MCLTPSANPLLPEDMVGIPCNLITMTRTTVLNIQYQPHWAKAIRELEFLLIDFYS